MSTSDAAASRTDDPLETGAVCTAVGCTRNVFARLRRDYPHLQPLRRLGNGILLWHPQVVGDVRRLLEQEERLRERTR